MAEVWNPPALDDIVTTETVTAAYLNQLGNSVRFLKEVGVYQEVTSDVSITGTGEVDVISLGAVTFENVPCWLEFYAGRATAGASGTLRLEIKDGSTYYGSPALLAANTTQECIYVKRRITPSAGSHTFRVTAQNGASQTSTVNAGAGNADNTRVPIWIAMYRIPT